MKRTSLQGALTAYLLSLEERAYSPETLKTRNLTLSRFLHFLAMRGVPRGQAGALSDIRRVSEADIAAYVFRLARKKTRFGRPSTPRTQGESLSVIRHFFGFLVKTRVIFQDPARDFDLPRVVHQLPRHVPNSLQTQRLMDAPNSETPLGRRDRAILELLYGSGLRAGELRRLDLTHLDLEKGIVFVSRGKGAKDRMTPLSVRSIASLALYLLEARPLLAKKPRELALFLSLQGTRMGKSTLQERLKVHARAARLSSLTTLHSLRHACATHLLQGGASIRHIQAILGHRHLQSTAIYTRVNTKDLAKVLERAHPSERRFARQARRKVRAMTPPSRIA